MEFQLYKALVIDTKDEDKQGKIKIRVLPELEKVEDSLLPWAIPFLLDCSDSSLCNKLPTRNSTIRVLIDKYWKRFYYLSNPYFYKLFDYNKIESTLKKGKDANKQSIDTTYENIQFNLYEDGGLEFHNIKDGSHGFIHKSGGYSLFDKDGSIIVESPSQNIFLVNDNGKLLLNKNGQIDIESTNQTIKLSNSVDSLGSILEELVNDLSGLTTVGSPTTQTSPQLTSQMATLLPKIKKLFR